MAITLHYTTIDDCDTKDSWETVGDGQNIADSSYPPRQGTQCIEFDIAPNKNGGIKNTNSVSSFSIRTYEVGLWFLNPVVDKDGNYVIANQEDGLILRLYSSNGNYADFYQTQHRRYDGEWNGGWLYLRASGGVGDEDSNSGTWTENDTDNITNIAVIINSGAGDSSDKDSGKFGVDWGKYYDYITITGDNSDAPWTLHDIYTTDIDKDSGGGIWGITAKYVDYYTLYAGIVFGDGNSGSFVFNNDYLYLEQSSLEQKYNIKVKNSFTVTCGVLDNGTETYANSGSIIFSNGKGLITIDDGATFGLYATQLQGFGTIDLSGATTVIKSDLYNNEVYSNHSSNVFKNSRLYCDSENRQDIGIIKVVPEEVTDITVFNADNGLEIHQDIHIDKYNAYNNVYDLVIKDGKEVILADSLFDSTKIKRVV